MDDQNRTIDITALLIQTFMVLESRHNPFEDHKVHKTCDRLLDMKTCGACLIKDSKLKYWLVMLNVTPFSGKPHKFWVSVYPHDPDDPKIPTKWGWKSDGYGSVVDDASFLRVRCDSGLLESGSILRIPTAETLYRIMSKIMAHTYRAVPARCFGNAGGLFEFAPAEYQPDAPERLADAIEQIVLNSC